MTSVNPASLRVSWQPPPEIDQNGPLTSYLILYSIPGSSNVTNITVTNRNEFTLSGLIAFSNYSVQVAARTVNGTGPISSSIIQTSGEDGKYVFMYIYPLFVASCYVWI